MFIDRNRKHARQKLRDERMKNVMRRIGAEIAACLRAFLSAAAFLAASSCSFNYPEYPPQWPRFHVPGSIATAIQGTFSCSGETVRNSAGVIERISVSELSIGGTNPPACDYLEIRSLSPDEIEVRFLQKGMMVQKRDLKKGRDYHVDDNWIVLTSKGSWVVEGILLAHETVSPSLSVNSKRDLIIRIRNTSLQTIMVILPEVRSGAEWGRFIRKIDEGTGMQTRETGSRAAMPAD